MLKYIASSVDPIYGILGLLAALIGAAIIVFQLFYVKKSQWDEHAHIALDEPVDAPSEE